MTKDKLRVRDSERFKSLVSLHLVKKKKWLNSCCQRERDVRQPFYFQFVCLCVRLSMCMFVSTSVLLCASLRILVFLQTHKSVCSRKDCKLNI